MCAIFSIFNVRKAAELTVIGLHASQHRAIDFAGIVSSDGTNHYRERDAGLARQVFDGPTIDRLHGNHTIGHLRYPTVTDDRSRDNIQPVSGIYQGKPIAIVHNGNLINTDALGVPEDTLSTSLDTEYILRLLQMENGMDFEEDLRNVLTKLQGSFSLCILLTDRLYAVRDSHGNRPLSVGSLEKGYAISSETCAFPNVGAKHLFDVDPGTFVCFSEEGKPRVVKYAEAEEKRCVFELIYFSHPTSQVFDVNVHDFRFRLGQALERHMPTIGADIVTPVPDSSNVIAQGYGDSRQSGVFRQVILRNHYVGRSFIAATQAKRVVEVANKFLFDERAIAGKKIVVVDDSIVRGTTIRRIVDMLRSLGAKEVHLRIAAPPIMHPCIYGIDTKTEAELIAAQMSEDGMREFVKADSLAFLPIEALEVLTDHPKKYCFACMNGEYWSKRPT